MLLKSQSARLHGGTIMSQTANSPLSLLRRLASFRYLLTPASKVRGRFIVLSQSRSGTTLLRRLLNSHPDVSCSGELLRKRVPLPQLYLETQSRRCPSKVTGSKVFIHHLLRNQKIKDPSRFLLQLNERGYKIIYLKRENILRHSVSQWLRKVTGVTHSSSNTEVPRHRVDVDFLIRHLKAREYYWEEAERALDGLPYHRITYENDLERSDHHQEAMDEIFSFLEVEPVAVKADLRRINDKQLSEIIENYEEVTLALSGTRYSRWLEEVAPEPA